MDISWESKLSQTKMFSYYVFAFMVLFLSSCRQRSLVWTVSHPHSEQIQSPNGHCLKLKKLCCLCKKQWWSKWFIPIICIKVLCSLSLSTFIMIIFIFGFVCQMMHHDRRWKNTGPERPLPHIILSSFTVERGRAASEIRELRSNHSKRPANPSLFLVSWSSEFVWLPLDTNADPLVP